MKRPLFIAFLMFTTVSLLAQSKSLSLGIFTGATATYTWDEGINRDPRYLERYDAKFAPFGISYGVDYEGFGFVLTPGVVKMGQTYHVINSVGGQEGYRRINLTYLNLPAVFKFHIIDLSFFKVSFIAGGGAGVLLNGKELVTHNAGKYRFPSEVYPTLEANYPQYEIEYDGVISPAVKDFPVSTKKDFNSFQLYGIAGFRSDWDVSDDWRVSFDFRVQYGIFDPRTKDYIKRTEAFETIYDIPGKRRDMFAFLSIGIARYVEIDHKDEAKKNQNKKSKKSYKPKKYPYRAPRNDKPKM